MSAIALAGHSDGTYQTLCLATMLSSLTYGTFLSLKDYERHYDGSWTGPSPASGKTTHGGAMLVSRPAVVRRVTVPWREGEVPRGGSHVFGTGHKGELLLYDDVHYGVLGQSGDGKSRRVIAATIVANVLQGKTVIVNDIKGELGDWICPWAKRQMTHRVVRIRLDNPVASDVRYDPLARARRHVEQGEVGDAVEELRELAACLIKTAGAGHDNFFPETARTLLLGLCLFVLTSPDVPDDCRNLSTVAALVEATGETDQMGRLLELRRMVGDDSPAKGFLGVVAGERGGGPGVVSEVSRALAPFVDPKIDVLAHDDELELDRLGEVPTLLLVSSSAATGDRGPVVNAFFSQVLSSLRTCAKRHGKRLLVPSVLVMDEFASIGRCERLLRDIGEIRSEGITLIACRQSLHQLQATSGYTHEEAKNLLDQLHTKLVLSCGDTEIAEMLSKTIRRPDGRRGGPKPDEVPKGWLDRNLRHPDLASRYDRGRAHEVEPL